MGAVSVGFFAWQTAFYVHEFFPMPDDYCGVGGVVRNLWRLAGMSVLCLGPNCGKLVGFLSIRLC